MFWLLRLTPFELAQQGEDSTQYRGSGYMKVQCSQMFWKCRVSEHFVFTSYFLVTLYLSSLPCWVVCLSEESKQCQYRRSAVQPVPPGLASWVKHRVLILSETIRNRDRRLNGRNWKTLLFLSRSPKHQGNRKTHLGGQHPRNATKLANI